MPRAKVLIVSGAEKNKLIDLKNDALLFIDNYRFTRIFLRTYVYVLIRLISFLIIIILVLSFTLIFRGMYQAIIATQKDGINDNLPISSCYLGVTTPCLANGAVAPLPVIELQDVYIQVENSVP